MNIVCVLLLTALMTGCLYPLRGTVPPRGEYAYVDPYNKRHVIEDTRDVLRLQKNGANVLVFFRNGAMRHWKYTKYEHGMSWDDYDRAQGAYEQLHWWLQRNIPGWEESAE